MKTITLKNEYGETIEVRRGGVSGVQVRHSDCTGDEWAEYYQHPKDYPKLPSIAENVIKAGGKLESPPAIEALSAFTRLGVRLILKGEDLILSDEEIKLINGAITQLE